MKEQKQHFLVGATLGTEDRGDICVRDQADNLLYRMVPTAHRPSESLAEVLRVCAFQASAVARRDGVAEAPTPAAQARDLIQQFELLVREFSRKAQDLPPAHARELLAVLSRGQAMAETAGNVRAALELYDV